MQFVPCRSRSEFAAQPDHYRCHDPRVDVWQRQVSPEFCQSCSFAEPSGVQSAGVVDHSVLGSALLVGHRRHASAESFRWSVGITTAPRTVPSLEQCLGSLALAGWDRPRIFAEPDALVPTGMPVTRRASRMGAWPHWYLSLAEMVMLDPLADCYFLLQDDVVFCRQVREFLEQDLWPARETGVISLCCPSIDHGTQQRPDYGPHEVKESFGLVGALTYLFPAASARAILQDSQIVEHRLRGHRRGLGNTGEVIGRWAQQTSRH